MKRRFAFTSFLIIAALLIAAVPAYANGPEFYWDISEDGMEAHLIQGDYDIQVYAASFVDCYGQVYEGEFDPPWNHIGWITVPEAGEGPLGYAGALIAYWDEEAEEWSEPFWVAGSRNCDSSSTIGSVCWEGNTTHVVGHDGWIIWDTLVEYEEGEDYIFYGEQGPTEANETWEDVVVYADAIFGFWNEEAEEWILSPIVMGAPCGGGGEPEPVVTGLWAYINPGAGPENGGGNICYILSLTQPTQSEESNDVQRLCFTELYPNWWDGATLLTSGDVFENGTDWGFWEGDAAANAFNPNARRLPLHAEGPNNDLLDKAEMFPWTQE